jgi:antitoxin component YwqK of YwqJK toxin-antitoxin module
MPKREPEARVRDSELEYDDELTYRWHGSLFTGVGFDEAEDGSRSEVTYHYGVQDGPARDWYPSGVLKGESWFRDNVQHGITREYSQDGNLSEEISFEYGIMVYKLKRDQSGHMIETFRIDPDSQNYSRLERYRREKGWPA